MLFMYSNTRRFFSKKYSYQSHKISKISCKSSLCVTWSLLGGFHDKPRESLNSRLRTQISLTSLFEISRFIWIRIQEFRTIKYEEKKHKIPITNTRLFMYLSKRLFGRFCFATTSNTVQNKSYKRGHITGEFNSISDLDVPNLQQPGRPLASFSGKDQRTVQ